MSKIFHISTRRVGGIRFLKIGRICFTLSVAAAFQPITRA